MKKFSLKRAAAAGMAVLTAAAVMTGCGDSGNKEEGGKSKVVLNEVAHSIFYAPMYVAIEEGYFEEEGIDLTLVTGFGADKTMTAVLTGEADIGFMGCESTVYTYAGGTEDYVVNFAQLTQRAGNFLVSREPIEGFSWDMLKGVLTLDPRQQLSPVGREILRWNLNLTLHPWNRRERGMWWHPWGRIRGMCHTLLFQPGRAIWRRTRRQFRPLPMLCREEWTMCKVILRRRLPK